MKNLSVHVTVMKHIFSLFCVLINYIIKNGINVNKNIVYQYNYQYISGINTDSYTNLNTASLFSLYKLFEIYSVHFSSTSRVGVHERAKRTPKKLCSTSDSWPNTADYRLLARYPLTVTTQCVHTNNNTHSFIG